MMALASSRNNNGLQRLPSIPVIEHPSSRHVKGKLEVLGSSSSQNGNAAKNKGPLPPLRNEENRYSREKGRRHSRGATWPADLGDGHGVGSFSQKQTVDELKELIYDKLASGFYGVRQAFKSSDPKGKGNVSREAFKHILYHLCGYVSPLQFSGLLHRLGIESQSTISFDDFIRHFKDAEIVQKEWMDPILRPTSIQAKYLPANRLRITQREAQSKKNTEITAKQGKKPIPKYYTALQVFPMIKRKANENFLEFAKLFPSSCFEEDGMVLKPQLRYALYSMNMHIYDDEYDKVWDRVDRSGMGAVDTYIFFKALGLHTRRDAKIEKKAPDIEYNVPVVIKEEPKEPQEDQAIEKPEEKLPKAEEPKVDEQKIDRAESGLSETNVKNGDLLKILDGKFRHGYDSILALFARYDTQNTGMVTRGEFRRVLSMCRLNLGTVEVEHFLSRFGVREQQMVPYCEILDAFEDRTDKGILQKILDDSQHRFNRSRESDIGNTTAFDAEAKLLDILHADFLALLAAFKQLDREDLGLVKKYQFQEMLDARFGIKLTKSQISEMLQKIGAETPEGLVLYGRFLEEFSAQRDHHTLHADAEDRPATTNSLRPSTCPTRPMSVQSVRSPGGVDRSASFADIKKSTPAARDVDELMAEIGHLLTDKFQVINKTFIGIDKASRNCGNLTRETFRQLFERHSLKLSVSEVDHLWKKLPIERDGTLSFIELVKTCFSVVGKTPPRDHDEYQTKGLSRALQNFARSHVRKTLENFQEEEENQHNDVPYEACVTSSDSKTEKTYDNDVKPKEGERPKFDVIMSRIKHEVRENFNQIKDGFLAARNQNQNTIDKHLLTKILLKHCNSLTGLECEVIVQKFDRDETGRIRYEDFLKVFLPTMPEGTDPIASPWQPRHRRTKTYPDTRRVSSNEALQSIMNHIRNKLILDWKALRRAMKKSDKNGDGMITVVDFKAVMKAFGFPLKDEDFYHIFSTFDVNMDGRISYVAFMKETLM